MSSLFHGIEIEEFSLHSTPAGWGGTLTQRTCTAHHQFTLKKGHDNGTELTLQSIINIHYKYPASARSGGHVRAGAN
jgi:hypothetical protein